MGITPEIVEEAQRLLNEYIGRRTASEKTVQIAKPLYHQGLSNIRCVLCINGKDTRMLYSPKEKLWRKAAI